LDLKRVCFLVVDQTVNRTFAVGTIVLSSFDRSLFDVIETKSGQRIASWSLGKSAKSEAIVEHVVPLTYDGKQLLAIAVNDGWHVYHLVLLSNTHRSESRLLVIQPSTSRTLVHVVVPYQINALEVVTKAVFPYI